MIGIVGMLIANQSIFIHTHKLADNSIVSHSHPYDKSNDSEPYKSHHHTNVELLFFQNLAILFLTVIVSLAFLIPIKKAEYLLHTISIYSLSLYNPNKGRAPPISSYHY